MRGIHVGLNLEHHAAELGLVGLNGSLKRHPWLGGRCQFDQGIEDLAHPKVVHRGPKEDRRLLSCKECGLIKGRGGTLHQVDLLAGLTILRPEALEQRGVVQAIDHIVDLACAVFPRLKDPHLVCPEVHDTVKAFAHAHGPCEGNHGHPQGLLKLIHQRNGLAHLSVHFVDEGQDGCISSPADLQKAKGLLFHTIGRIDDHQGCVHGREHPIGVLGEVSVPRCVEQVDDVIPVLHLHDRTRNRNATLFLDLHPVGGGVSGGLTGLDAAGDVNGTCVEQEFLSECGLAGVWVRDDGKGAAAANFLGQWQLRHGDSLTHPSPNVFGACA